MTQKVFNKVKAYLLTCQRIDINIYNINLHVPRIQSIIAFGEDWIEVEYKLYKDVLGDTFSRIILNRKNIRSIIMYSDFSTQIRTRANQLRY